MNHRYTPVTRLGSGGMADVFLTIARGAHGVTKLAVVKRLRERGDTWLQEMFLDEARVATRLNHPNIVHAYEMWEARGDHFLAMEYVEGMPLNEILRELSSRKDGLSEPIAAYIAGQVLKGLHYVHEVQDFDGTPLGILHRDVSPHNICITYDGNVKLLDFGVAKSSLSTTHTQQGALKGKVRYMAPEQARAEELDRRADVFALGIVLWEMLARGPLFQGHAMSILGRVMRADVPSLGEARADISPELIAITERALRPSREERYESAEEMQRALETFAGPRSDDEARRELVHLMGTLFSHARDALRARVQACLSLLPAEPEGPDSHPVFASAGGAPELVRRGTEPTETLTPPEAPSVRATRPRIDAALAVLFVATAAVLIVAFNSARHPQRETWPAAGSAETAPLPSAIAPAKTEEVPRSSSEPKAPPPPEVSAPAREDSRPPPAPPDVAPAARSTASPPAYAPAVAPTPRAHAEPPRNPPARTVKKPRIKMLDDSAP